MFGPVEATKNKPKFKVPKEFADERDFLADMRQLYDDDLGSDKLNRDAAVEDLRFLAGDQWSDDVRLRRNASRKPTFTFNRLPAFVAQIVGHRLQNETTIKVVADEGSDVAVAQVREDLLRNIQKTSKAEKAYDNALLNCVTCGIGNFKIAMDYRAPDVWEQDIQVKAITDALAVVWDRMCREPTGKDAKHVFETFVITKKQFKKDYPWAVTADWTTDFGWLNDTTMNGWVTVDDVRIVSYWSMRSEKRILALMTDGATNDITDHADDPATLANVVIDGTGNPVIREVDMPYAEQYLCAGCDILEGPYRLPISRVPIFRVPGWEVQVGEWRHRWGLIRFLKDPQRLHNYWRSIIGEKLLSTPRAVWIATQEAVAGRESAFRQSHISDDPLLIWNGDAGQEPKRLDPTQIQDALIGEAEMTNQDLKDISNIHEANLGMPSNEVSGAAIMARQRVSDTGTVLYHENLNDAIEEAGRVMDELVPFCYDTARVVKTLGADGKDNAQVINDEFNPNSIDITAGRYLVSVTTGPSYATKRIETTAAMLATLQVAPQMFQYIADLWVEAQDWPKAEEIARRVRLAMDPSMLDPDQVTPEQAQAAQGKAQAQQAQAAMSHAAQVAQITNVQAQAALAASRARNFMVEADLAGPKVNIQASAAAARAAEGETNERVAIGKLEE